MEAEDVDRNGKDRKDAVKEKDEGNAAFLRKLERGLAEVRAGQGIVKTLDELEEMAGD